MTRLEFRRDAGGVIWAFDGTAEMAGAVEERMRRFFNRGIAARRLKLTRRHLVDKVPILAGDFVINVGANIGEVAITLADWGASVFAIEPDPNVLPALRANAAGRPIEVVPVAAWHEDGPLQMYIDTAHGDTSAFNPSPEPTFLEARRIDTLMGDRPTTRIRLIVGDAEGAEPEVLEGARETLKRTEYVSLAASAERCGERTLDACEAMLRTANFDIIHREETKFCTIIGKARRD